MEKPLNPKEAKRQSKFFIEDTEIPERVTRLLYARNNAAKAGMWLKTPNPELDGDTPLARIQAGDVQSIINLLSTSFP